MGSVFHQLCPRYSGTLTSIAPTANRLWKTFTCTSVTYVGSNPAVNIININIRQNVLQGKISKRHIETP